MKLKSSDAETSHTSFHHPFVKLIGKTMQVLYQYVAFGNRTVHMRAAPRSFALSDDP